MAQYVYLILAILFTIFFIYLVLKLIEFLDSLKNTLTNLETNLSNSVKSINNTLNKLEPVINNLNRVEEDILVTLTDLRNKSNKIEPLFSEIISLTNTYKKIGESIDNTINTQVKSILSDFKAVSSSANDVVKDVSQRIENSKLVIDEIHLLSHRFTVTTSTLLNSLQDLAIEVSSTTYGIKKTIEYLRDNLLFKGGK